MKRSRQTTCLNCNRDLNAAYHFCPDCGQKTAVHRLSLHAIVHDFFHYFTHVDRNIFALIKNLSYRPGFVAEEYLKGKRKKYFPPVNFFLIVAGLLVISVSLFHTFQVAFADGTAASQKNTSPLLTSINSKINWIFLLLTPVIASLYRLVFIRKQHNFIEHLAIGLYAMGYLLFLFAAVIAPAFYFINTLIGFEIILWGFVAALCIYYSLTYYQLYHKKGIADYLKYLLLSAVVFAIVLLLIIACLRLYYKWAV